MQRRKFLQNASLTGASILTSASILSDKASGNPKNPAAEKPFNLNYAVHDGMFRNHAGNDFIDQIKFAYDKGFRAVEDNGMRRRDKALQEKIGSTLASMNVKMGVFVSHDIDWSKPSLSSGDKDDREKFLGQIRESVDVAKRCGSKWMVVVPGVMTPGLDPAYQKAHVIDTLRKASDILMAHNLVMVLEPLNFRDHPGQLLPDIPNIYTVVKAVNSPACKMIFDVYHVQIHSGNIIPNMDMAWDEIEYIQLGDNPGRKEPTTGEINYKNVFKHIHKKGYKGLLGMEHGNSQPGKEGELALIKAYRECDGFM
jgi:hydroxypyruvate isomerase